MADIRQQELDFAEQQVLTDIFGGYTADKFVFKMGFLKFDFHPKVQKAISDFENLVKPMMDDDGFVDIDNLKKFINEDYINLPSGKYRLIDIYRQCQPFVNAIVRYVKG